MLPTSRGRRISIQDVLIVTTLNGDILGINKDNGEILWQIEDALGPLIKIEQEASNLNNEGVINIDLDQTESDSTEVASYSHNEGRYIIEPIGDVNLYKYIPGIGIKKLPFSLKHLVHTYPSYVSPETNAMYTSRKSSILYAINPLTGKLLSSFGEEAQTIFADYSDDNSIRVYLGRIQYQLNIADVNEMTSKRIHYGEYTSTNPIDPLLMNRIGLGMQGELIYKDEKGIIMWEADLPSQVSSVFAIVRLKGSGYALTQLQSSKLHLKGQVDKWIKRKVPVYVGSLHGSSFIMPIDKFDLSLIPSSVSSEFYNPILPPLIECSNYPECHGPMITEIDNNWELFGRSPHFSPVSVAIGIICLVMMIAWTCWVYAKRKLYRNNGFKEIETKETLLVVNEIIETNEEETTMDEQPNNDPNLTVDEKEQDNGNGHAIKDKEPSNTTYLEVSNTVLGHGSHGTIVFKGSFEGRPVAVKRLLSEFYDVAHNEINLLKDSDHHPNVIRYFYKEQSDQFLFIALELAPASLSDVIEQRNSLEMIELKNKLIPKVTMYQIAQGLHHLHSLNIVHRDLKPQNILLAETKGKKQSHPRILISDFGLCKRLADDQSSFHNTAKHGGGTVGWRAPECFSEAKSASQVSSETSSSSTTTIKITRKIDIFSAGCVYYYILSDGEHPFGERLSREINILKGNFKLERLTLFPEDQAESKDLIKRMIAKDAKKRLLTDDVLVHPYFWNATKRLNFLQDVSDRLEKEERDPPSKVLKQLERGAIKVIGSDWYRKLDRLFIDTLGKFRKYEGNNLQDLLRVLRNKKHHYHELPSNVQKLVGGLPDEYLRYFTSRYPDLMVYCYHFVISIGWREDQMFKRYYEEE